MTKTQIEILDCCRKLATKQNEYSDIEIEGERFPRQLKNIQLEIDIAFIDIEILSHDLLSEEQ